ncbi:hypothetical protein ABMA27_000593 [Loxostege sticticalis]|uniref:Protein furry n=1 Tax=Loxostege sticticalis TaxID=481309 RepID=A0ABR3INZ6_LOXSC
MVIKTTFSQALNDNPCRKHIRDEIRTFACQNSVLNDSVKHKQDCFHHVLGHRGKPPVHKKLVIQESFTPRGESPQIFFVLGRSDPRQQNKINKQLHRDLASFLQNVFVKIHTQCSCKTANINLFPKLITYLGAKFEGSKLAGSKYLRILMIVYHNLHYLLTHYLMHSNRDLTAHINYLIRLITEKSEAAYMHVIAQVFCLQPAMNRSQSSSIYCAHRKRRIDAETIFFSFAFHFFYFIHFFLGAVGMFHSCAQDLQGLATISLITITLLFCNESIASTINTYKRLGGLYPRLTPRLQPQKDNRVLVKLAMRHILYYKTLSGKNKACAKNKRDLENKPSWKISCSESKNRLDFYHKELVNLRCYWIILGFTVVLAFTVTYAYSLIKLNLRGLKMRRNGSSKGWYGSVCFALDLAGALPNHPSSNHHLLPPQFHLNRLLNICKNISFGIPARARCQFVIFLVQLTRIFVGVAALEPRVVQQLPMWPWVPHLKQTTELPPALPKAAGRVAMRCWDRGLRKKQTIWSRDGCLMSLIKGIHGLIYLVLNTRTSAPPPLPHYTIIQHHRRCTRNRFASNPGMLILDTNWSEKGRGTLDALLCTTYCRSQLYLSRQLSQLHPELTMPMFSEITARFQTARTEVRQLLLQYLLPWLVNIELVDPNVPPANPLSYIEYYADAGRGGRREGLGSAEATEMVLNNLFYITAKFSDNHPKEIEELWSTLCACWPNNLKVIIRYLIIVSGMAPNELLPYAKRVVLYLARSRPERLLDEMMTELQTVETLNCLIERTETPPFYRLTSMRKATSGHSDGPGTGSQDATGRTGELAPVEKGTIHTKRHSGEDPAKATGAKAPETPGPRAPDKRASAPPCVTPPAEDEPPPPSDGDATPTGLCPESSATPTGGSAPATPQEARAEPPQPRPLPMPEYGGFFALLTEYLPDNNQPISGFHRCNVAVMLLCDVVLDGVELDWSIHVPLMLHIVFLGMDHTRWIVHQHCRQLLLNLLVAVAAHHDHLTVARVLLASRSQQLGLGISPPSLPLVPHNFTEPDASFDAQPACAHSPRSHARSLSSDPQVTPEAEGDNYPSLPVIVTNEPEEAREGEPAPAATDAAAAGAGAAPEPAEVPVADLIKSLVHFLANRPTHMPLWQYEDITAKVWSLRSCQQMATLLRHVVRVFRESLPHALVSERWAQTALQLGLSCPSRHYAGRSLQVFRFIGVAMTGRMVSDILSRLVETVAEQGEDMQGYVTELLLTLEAAVDSLESNFRPLDYMRDIFKSTPNLNNKDGGPQPNGNAYAAGKRSPGVCVGCVSNHTRSTSYSVSYCVRKNPPAAPDKHQHANDRTRPCSEAAKGVCSNLCRSRSAQSLKLLGDSATQDDKLTILATLFWVGASLLESDYEHEFLLGVRLLARVMARLPLDRPDARERLDRTQAHCAPSLHALLLKGCTHPNTYEPVVGVLADMIPLLELPVIDPTQSLAFPMTVVALLPYMLLHYEDANELCVRAACHIAQFTAEKSKKLENLGTVMTLYSRRTFSKESFQWTKCVVKYLWDTYSHLSMQMLAFLVEVLEKGAVNLQLPVLSVLHCMLYYVELSAPAAQPVTADLLRAVVKFLDSCAQDGGNYKEAMKILKLVVTRCSTLVVPPYVHSHAAAAHLDSHKKELPGRTMEFTFDLSQTPVIGRKYLPKAGSQPATGPSSLSNASNASTATPDKGSSTSASGSASTVVGAESGGPSAQPASAASPRRSLSLSPADALASGWKRPWMSQSRVRECLVNLLTTCGQRVGLPKSPSVIFSQSSELLERESSMASSLEEVSGTPGNEPSNAAPPNDHFGVFKDFDFLEYESESIEGESSDNFNWGVRRRLLSEERSEGAAPERSPPPQRPRQPDHALATKSTHEDSSDEEGAWDEGAAGRGEGDAGTHELALRPRTHSFSSASSGEPDGDRGDVTPVPGAGGGALRDAWRASVAAHLRHAALVPPVALVHRLHTVLKEVTYKTVSLCSESSATAPGTGGAELGAVLQRLAGEEPPLLWVGPAAADCARVRDAVRFAALEINEHLETYFDRREHALEGVEMSMGVCAVRAALAAAGDDAGEHSPAPADDARLLHLMQRQKWGAALALVRERNAERILERGELPEDDVTSLLHVYCKGLAQAHPDMVAITRPVNELSQNLSFMMESLYKVSVALTRQELG